MMLWSGYYSSVDTRNEKQLWRIRLSFVTTKGMGIVATITLSNQAPPL